MSDHSSNNNKARVEFIARITDADGQVIEKTVSASDGFKSSDDFDLSTRDGFLADFDALEKAVLEARNKAAEEISSGFLELASKKNKSRGAAKKQPPQSRKQAASGSCLSGNWHRGLSRRNGSSHYLLWKQRHIYVQNSVTGMQQMQ